MLINQFPVTIEQVVAWGDMDAFGHVNNVVYFRYFENARVELIQRIGWWDYLTTHGVGPIVASTSARFRRPVKYPETLIVGARVIAMGRDRFTLQHAAWSKASGEMTTEGEAVVVAFDYRAGAKTAIPEALRHPLEML